jgi:hypothetical protein
MAQVNNPADLIKIRQALQECSNALTRTEAERDLISDIIKNTCDSYDLDKKVFRKMMGVYHKRNLNEEVQQHEDFVNLYTTVTGAQNGTV